MAKSLEIHHYQKIMRTFATMMNAKEEKGWPNLAIL